MFTVERIKLISFGYLTIRNLTAGDVHFVGSFLDSFWIVFGSFFVNIFFLFESVSKLLNLKLWIFFQILTWTGNIGPNHPKTIRNRTCFNDRYWIVFHLKKSTPLLLFNNTTQYEIVKIPFSYCFTDLAYNLLELKV